MSADIRRLVEGQVSADTQLGGMLAVFDGQPAFFYQKAPHDDTPGWGTPKYPRLDFNVDMRHDPERKTEGTMTFNIVCSRDCPDIGGQDPDRAIATGLPCAQSGSGRMNSSSAGIRGRTHCRKFTD